MLENDFLQKMLYQIICQSILGGLIQATNMSKHISRNGGATIKASRKTAHDKVFFILGQNGHFSQKWWHHEKGYRPKSNVLLYERRLMVKVWSMTKFLC